MVLVQIINLFHKSCHLIDLKSFINNRFKKKFKSIINSTPDNVSSVFKNIMAHKFNAEESSQDKNEEKMKTTRARVDSQSYLVVNMLGNFR